MFYALPGPFISTNSHHFNAQTHIVKSTAWPLKEDHLFLSQYKQEFEVRKISVSHKRSTLFEKKNLSAHKSLAH